MTSALEHKLLLPSSAGSTLGRFIRICSAERSCYCVEAAAHPLLLLMAVRTFQQCCATAQLMTFVAGSTSPTGSFVASKPLLRATTTALEVATQPALTLAWRRPRTEESVRCQGEAQQQRKL